MLEVVLRRRGGGCSNCVRLEQQTISKITEKTDLLVNMINIFDSHLRRDTGVFAKLFAEQFPEKFTLDTDTLVEVAGRKTPTLKKRRYGIEFEQCHTR